MARTLNLGILAHVDAGKTTLTERLLYAAGVIDAPGSVDKGTTRTDSLELERRRGITIKTAVVSFPLEGMTVNLVDTPGHPDFIAEVERSLSILDGAVLVLSAVEGVQSQTRLLMRALERLGVPTLLFANKIDRVGARDDGLLAEIRQRLTPDVVALGQVDGLGTRLPSSPRQPTATAASGQRSRKRWPSGTTLSLPRSSRTRRSRTRACARSSRHRRGGRSCTRSSSAPRSPAPAWRS